MTTNNFPNIGYTTTGHDFNFFQKLNVTATTFGGNSVSGKQPDMIITFSTYGVILTNIDANPTGTFVASKVIEYSFNGQTVHGTIGSCPGDTVLTFENRVVSTIWFRIQSGSSSANISVQAWGIR
jgi:hypothetical protein